MFSNNKKQKWKKKKKAAFSLFSAHGFHPGHVVWKTSIYTQRIREPIQESFEIILYGTSGEFQSFVATGGNVQRYIAVYRCIKAKQNCTALGKRHSDHIHVNSWKQIETYSTCTRWQHGALCIAQPHRCNEYATFYNNCDMLSNAIYIKLSAVKQDLRSQGGIQYLQCSLHLFLINVHAYSLHHSQPFFTTVAPPHTHSCSILPWLPMETLGHFGEGKAAAGASLSPQPSLPHAEPSQATTVQQRLVLSQTAKWGVVFAFCSRWGRYSTPQ